MYVKIVWIRIKEIHIRKSKFATEMFVLVAMLARFDYPRWKFIYLLSIQIVYERLRITMRILIGRMNLSVRRSLPSSWRRRLNELAITSGDPEDKLFIGQISTIRNIVRR